MPNFRYYLRLIVAFVVRFKVILLVGIFVGAVLFVIITYFWKFISSPQIARIGITGRYRPDSLPVTILEQVGEGLTRFGENGSVEPGLASSWSTTDSGKTWIFELRDDATWQDGQNVTSQTISYDFSDVQVEKPDDKTIIFKLENAYGAFPSVVSKPIFKQGLLGTGNWKVTNMSVSGNFVQELVVTNESRGKKIYKFYPTEDRAKLAFKLGEVDEIHGIFDPEPFTNWKTARVEQATNLNKVAAIFLNIQDPLLSEKSFRQALGYAINKDEFESPRAIGPISPLSWAYNPQVKTYNYDPKRATELTKDLPDSGKEGLELQLISSPTFFSAAEIVAKNWTDAGIKTTVQVSPGIPSEYQAFLVVFDIPKDPDQYVLWHSTQTATNISKYQNARIDKLLEDGRMEVDVEGRKRIYLDFQRFLLEDLPAIFLFHPTTYTVTRN